MVRRFPFWFCFHITLKNVGGVEQEAGKHQSPEVILGIPRELMLEHVRLANLNLQCVDCIIHACNTGGVSIWNLVLRLEQGVIKSLEKLGRHADVVHTTRPSIH